LRADIFLLYKRSFGSKRTIGIFSKEKEKKKKIRRGTSDHADRWNEIVKASTGFYHEKLFLLLLLLLLLLQLYSYPYDYSNIKSLMFTIALLYTSLILV